MNVTGIILAGGKSSRMGTDKSIVLYQNKPMIEYSINLLKKVCNELLISGNADNLHSYSVPIIPDIYKEIGPLAGIYSAGCKVTNDYFFTITCDIPHMDISVIKKLQAQIGDKEAALPIHSNGKIEPLIGLFKTSIIDKIKFAIDSGNFKMKDFLKSISVEYVEFEDALFFKNVNTKEDIL